MMSKDRKGYTAYVDSITELRKQLISLSERGRPAYIDKEQLDVARARLLNYAGTPLSTFRGTVKQIASSMLNEVAISVMDNVFPTFSNTVAYDPKKTLEVMNSELGKGNKELFDAVFNELSEKEAGQERQPRRYGGDKNFPRGRYFTVCEEQNGNDSQTLCRELFAYIDSSKPGWAFVSDPWDSQVYNTLGGRNLPNELHNCVYVMLLEPFEKAEQATYQRVYGPVLKWLANPYGLKLFPIPVQWFDVEIPNVLDLRQPVSQEWLFDFFKDGDGAVLFRPVEVAQSFFDMLPAMYHPYRGGSGFTEGLGSWLRIMGINALIYPSARSDASIRVDSENEVIEARGWNMVLYAGSEASVDKQLHVDSNRWYSFEGAGYKEVELHREDPSWRLSGIESGYSSVRNLILAALKKAKMTK